MCVGHHIRTKGFTVQDPDRWCSHTAFGQEFWLILAQWIWNLRLELGHLLHPTPMRTTEVAPAQALSDPTPIADKAAPVAYEPPKFARPAQMGGFAGDRFTLQPDGTLRCPADRPLYAQERRPERDGSRRVLYAARVGHCRACPLREHCQGYGTTTKKPRRVSAVLWPIKGPPSESTNPPAPPPTSHPLLWGDWERRSHRRELVKLLRHQRVDIQSPELPSLAQPLPTGHLSRTERAHWRLSWKERLARNAHPQTACQVTIKLFGVPPAFAAFLGLPIA
jgi:hypothetical protein